ncbi:NACHT domain-containing protein [Streptomyces sp. NPDC058280]|uniref:NACHT domain-containing protein n=1 Tax=Streptomyces sp. NPDC058280 TaxID=3346419 RepID=UPI0036E048DC
MAAAVLGMWLPIYFGPLGEWMKERPPPFIAWMEQHTTFAVVLFMAATALAVLGSMARQPNEPQPVAELAETLATAVAEQWRREEAALQLQAPWPIPLRWENTARPVADHWEAINGTHDLGEPVDLSGRLDGDGRADDDGIVAVFHRVASRRLVILGAPGAGKTVLALNLVLHLLDRRQEGERVPVLLPMGSWDPAQETLHSWMARRLAEDDPALRSRSRSGATLGRELIDSGQVLPVLDGLDEMPPQARSEALAALSRQLGRGEPLVLTCRADEYQRTVGSTVLTAAAVVELCPLDPADLRTYLRVSTVPARTGCWDPLFAEVESTPGGPVAQALSTPLMAWLARTAYADTTAEPAELLAEQGGVRRFADRTAVEEHLLQRLIPAVYSRDLPGEDTRRWSGEEAHRWLSFLARHLDKFRTPDLAWWQLGTTVPLASRMVLVGIATGLVYGLLSCLVHGLGGFGLMDVLVSGLLNGSMTGLSFGLAHGVVARFIDGAFQPSRVRLSLRGRQTGRARPRFLPRFMAGLVVGPIAQVTGNLLAGVVNVAAYQEPFWLLARVLNAGFWGLVVGVGAALVLGSTAWFEEPIDTQEATSPTGLLNTNRATVLRQALVLGVVFGLLILLGSWVMAGLLPRHMWGVTVVWTPAMGLRSGILSGLGSALVAALALTAWGRWVVLARGWLPLTGRLPWAVSAFLEDAHRRGVLRRNGAFYQFRHARLQHHLAPAPPPLPPQRRSRPRVRLSGLLRRQDHGRVGEPHSDGEMSR